MLFFGNVSFNCFGDHPLFLDRRYLGTLSAHLSEMLLIQLMTLTAPG